MNIMKRRLIPLGWNLTEKQARTMRAKIRKAHPRWGLTVLKSKGGAWNVFKVIQR